MGPSDAPSRPSQRPKAPGDASTQAHPEFPQVFGKYVLLRPMARGGMGELFLSVAGEVGGFEKLCVVKKVLGNLTDRTVHGRFLDEAKVVVRLNHSNLVQVFDAGSVNDEYYLTMELVEGKDLRAIWNRCAQLKRRIPVEFAISVIRDVCRGLDYVHNAGGLEMVHRDISPPNILVSYHGQVKITDFGLAKHTIKSEFTMPGVVYGRYSYLAPEQARGQAADRRSDIYAAGIVLWEMLTGRQMFPLGNNGRQVTELRALCNPTFVPPSSLVPGIPEGLDQVLAKALAPERDDRYSAAEEFRHALKGVLSRHFPAYDLDRVSEFMRDIFEKERSFELEDYANYAREDFSSVRTTMRKRASTPAPPQESPAQVPEGEHQDASSPTGPPPKARPRLPEPGKKAPIPPTPPTVSPAPVQEQPSRAISLDPPEAGLAPAPASSGGEHELSSRARIGRVVNNRYRIDRLVGIGAMGAVYVATHLGLEKEYAIKILHERCEAGSDTERRFLTEARAATRPSHPNIVDVCNIGTTENGEPFLVMELLDGVDLAQVIKQHGTLPISRMASIVGQVCDALAAAHRAGIVHRDLKSENIMVINHEDEADFVKVLDFGICKQIDTAGGPNSRPSTGGLVIGSPDYMAPEQARGDQIDGRADIYALGTIMFEMLSGKLPFEGVNAVEVLTKKATQVAPSISTLCSDLPKPVVTLVDKCLAREPSRRPATMRMVAYELVKATQGRLPAVAGHLGVRPADLQEAAIEPDVETSLEPTLPFDPDDPSMKAPASPPIPPAPLAEPSGPLASLAHSGSAAGDWWDLRQRSSKLVALGCALGCFALGAGISHWNRPVKPVSGKAVAVPASKKADAAGTNTDKLSAKPRAGKGAPSLAPNVVAQGGQPPKVVQAPEPKTKADLVQYWLDSAESAMKREHWTAPAKGSLAVALFNLSLIEPSHQVIGRLRHQAAKVLGAKASTAYGHQNWKLAVRNYRDLLAVMPDHRNASRALTRSLGRWTKESLRNGDNRTADLASAELLNRKPDSVDAHWLRASVLEAVSDPEAAAAQYRAIIRLEPGNGRARAALRRGRKRRKKADGE